MAWQSCSWTAFILSVSPECKHSPRFRRHLHAGCPLLSACCHLHQQLDCYSNWISEPMQQCCSLVVVRLVPTQMDAFEQAPRLINTSGLEWATGSAPAAGRTTSFSSRPYLFSLGHSEQHLQRPVCPHLQGFNCPVLAAQHQLQRQLQQQHLGTSSV